MVISYDNELDPNVLVKSYAQYHALV